MARPKTTEPKTASKAKPVKVGEKVPPKKRIPKPKEENILHPPFEKHCSYCGKPSVHAPVLIARPPPLFPYICDECVEVCVKILFESGPPDWRSRIVRLLAIQPVPQKTPSTQPEAKPRYNKKVEKSNA
jgi:hypothetical protein